MTWQHDPTSVLAYAQEGRVEEWVHAYLSGPGGNQPFSEGLRLAPRYWSGPVLIRLELLARCYGPEPTMEYVADVPSWERHVGRMQESLSKGWQPPPLIAQWEPGGSFSLRDGNHRHEALRREGVEAYWTVFWSDSEEARSEAEARLK